ncbi:MAG: iron-sulfur cluster assembly accessory protein [Armatimonadetes bacterium]|nr:iron-sulfur cluster assembly accessory protein [Armatimonadota bacterium]
MSGEKTKPLLDLAARSCGYIAARSCGYAPRRNASEKDSTQSPRLLPFPYLLEYIATVAGGSTHIAVAGKEADRAGARFTSSPRILAWCAGLVLAIAARSCGYYRRPMTEGGFGNNMTATAVAAAPVLFSERAGTEIRAVLERESRAGDALRIFVAGAGCSGLQYGMGIEAEAAEGDTEFVQHGLRVVIDGQSLQYMEGSTVEYVEEPGGAGFKIDNPNVTSGCSSCGSAGGCSGSE